MILCKACVHWREPVASDVVEGYENFGTCVLGESEHGYPTEDTKMFGINDSYVSGMIVEIKTAPDFGCVMGDDGKPKGIPVEIHIDYSSRRCCDGI